MNHEVNIKGTDFIKLESGTVININHIIAVDELDNGNALIVVSNEMFSYEDSRGRGRIEDLIYKCYGIDWGQKIGDIYAQDIQNDSNDRV